MVGLTRQAGASGTKVMVLCTLVLRLSSVCLQSVWRKSEYTDGLMSLNLARNACLIKSTLTSHNKTVPAL